jgi:hypothetical protein
VVKAARKSGSAMALPINSYNLLFSSDIVTLLFLHFVRI